MTGHHTVTVDFDACIGNGTCVLVAPQTFRLDVTGRLELLEDQVDEVAVESATEAAGACPVAAITVRAGS